MSKSKKENKGMIIIFIGALFSILGMMMMVLKENEYGNLSLIFSVLGVLIVVFGLFKIFKANRENGDIF